MSVSRGDVLTALREHAQSERLCQRAADVCLSAAKAKRADWLSARTVALDATPLTALSPSEAETPFGNLLGVLDRGAQTPLEWSVLGAGRWQIPFATQAVMMGGNVRVGLEDSLYIGRGQLAKSNAEQVAKMRRLVEELGYEVASPREARETLGLKGQDRTKF